MARKRKQYDDDDGRVIANMNVDGMPWFLSDALKNKGKTGRIFAGNNQKIGPGPTGPCQQTHCGKNCR